MPMQAVLTVNGVEHIFSLSAQQTGKCELLQLDTLSPGQPRAEDDFDSFDAPGGSRRAVPLAAVHARLAPQRTLDAQVRCSQKRTREIARHEADVFIGILQLSSSVRC